jgi:hypothetical protein
MNAEEIQRPREFEPGQLWKVEHGYVYITELGHRHIHYRMLSNPQQTVAMTRLIGIDALANFLRHSEARLISQPTQ